MALDKPGLINKLKQTLRDAKDQAWSSDQVAEKLADAIDTFVRSGDVVGIKTEVRDTNNSFVGNGTQTGTGSIK